MNILVKPVSKRKSSDSCNYTCPVYHTGLAGLKKARKEMKKEIHKSKSKKTRGRSRVCWYGN